MCTHFFLRDSVLRKNNKLNVKLVSLKNQEGMKDKAADALQAKLKRKEEELKLECLEETNVPLGQAKDNSNGCAPHKMALSIAQ